MTHSLRRTFAGALIAVSVMGVSAHAQTVVNPLQKPAPANERGALDQGNSNDAAAMPRNDVKQNERDARSAAGNQPNANQPAKDQGNANSQSSGQATQPNSSARQSGDRNANNQGSTNPQAGSNARRNRDRSGLDSSRRERTAMKTTDMRGPDIGLWFNRGNRDGLVISDVSTRGPIARLGFRESDRIVSVDGHRIATEADFINFLLNSNSDRVAVIVSRDGREETIYVAPNTLVDDYGYTEVDPIEQFGVVLDDRYDDRIVVWRVIPRSPAYYAGLREGDVISTLSDRPYTSRRDFETSIRDLRAGETNLQVRRGDRNRDLTIDVPEYERGARSEAKSEDRGARETDRNSSQNRTDQRGADRNDQGAGDKSNRGQVNQGSDRNNNDRGSNDRNNNPRPGAQNSPNQPNQPAMTGGNAGGERREDR